MESGDFVNYLKAPQVQDLILSYCTFIITGSISEELRHTKLRISANSGAVTEKDIANYLSNEFVKKHPDRQFSITIIKRFFAFHFDLIKNYYLSQLSNEQKSIILFVNSQITRQNEQLTGVFDRLSDEFKRMIASPIVATNIDYDKIKKEYWGILSEKNSRAHIYLLDTFPFSQFYISPKIMYNGEPIEERYFLRIANGKVIARLSMESMEMASRAMLSDNRDENGYTNWKYIFDNSNLIYLTGGAGYGKSLFLKNIINCYSELNIPDADNHIVIYGDLKSFYRDRDGALKSMLEFLQDCMKDSTAMDKSQLSYDFIQHYLDQGRCIILLDALDEVDKSKRTELHETIVAFFKQSNPNNKICITSRDRGFIPIEDIDCFSITPLDAYQIGLYVDRIIALKRFDSEDKDAFMKQTEILISKRFLNSFLVLSLLINIYKAELELPENKLELYQKCFEYIATRREREKTSSRYNWDRINPLMKDNTFIELAILGFPNNADISKNDIMAKLTDVYKQKFDNEVETENALDEFLNFCADRTELFVPSTAEDKFKFFHRSFFEYFYSQYIFLRCTTSEEIVNKMMRFDVDSEVFELTVAMFKQKSEEKYQAVISLILENTLNELSQPNQEFSSFNVAIILMQVVDDRRFVKQFLEVIIKSHSTLVNISRSKINESLLITFLIHNTQLDNAFFECFFADSIIDILYTEFFKSIKVIYQNHAIEKFNEKAELEKYSYFLMRKYSRLRFFTFKFLSNSDQRQLIYNFIFQGSESFIDWYVKMGHDKRRLKKIKRLLQVIDSLAVKEKKFLKEALKLMFDKLDNGSLVGTSDIALDYSFGYQYYYLYE